MLLVLYMEYLQRCALRPIRARPPWGYKTWLDQVTKMSEEEGEPIEVLCRPAGWQL